MVVACLNPIGIQSFFCIWRGKAKRNCLSLYHNPKNNYQTDSFTLDNFLERDSAYNSIAGVYELDKTAKKLKEILSKAIYDISNDKEIKIRFN